MSAGTLAKWLVWVGLFVLSGPLTAQVTFVLESAPLQGLEADALYMTGTFNNWDPADPTYQMEKNAAGKWQVEIPESKIPFEYKFTRGSWETVEGDSLGNANTNRKMEAIPDAPILVYVDSWEDQPPRPPKAWLEVIVESIPDNTPPAAPIYAVGNFNSWHPGDSAYQLMARADGSFVTQLPIYGNRLEFKFTRGNWQTVEGRRSGRARFNRVYTYEGQSSHVLRTRIESWEDISGSAFSAITIVWLMAAIMGILLVVAITTLQNNNVPANRVLAILIAVISVTLFGRVAVYDREIFQAFPRLLLVQDLILFLFAPVFLLYIRKLLHGQSFPLRSRFWLHMVPFVLHLIGYGAFFFIDKYTFISLNVDLSLVPVFAAVGGLALFYNVGYWLYIRRLIQRYQKSAQDNLTYDQNLSFLSAVMNLIAACLVIWLGAYIVGGIDLLVETDLENVTYRMLDVLFLAFSGTVFCLSYFAIREPEIFKIPAEEPVAVEEEETPLDEEATGDWTEMKGKLSRLMQSEQPFLNPKLTLAQLAELSGTNVHTLSRLINEGFGVNFNDYVNSYRVESFQKAALEEQYQNHTFLAIALMVGFNSKTAFNRSFKKLTGMTPREWMKSATAEVVPE